MNFYFKYRKWGAIFIEISPLLGLYPLYSFSKWKNEHIVELPWIKIILTPVSSIKEEAENIKNGETDSPSKTLFGTSGQLTIGHPPSYPES